MYWLSWQRHAKNYLRVRQKTYEEVKRTTLQAIVEETLTSGKYVSLFLISILYIKFKKLRDDPHIFKKNNVKTDNQRKLRKWSDQMHNFFYYSLSNDFNCYSIQATIN